MDFHPHSSMLPFAIFGGLAWLAVIGGVILLIIWAIRLLPASRVQHTTLSTVETPLETLARRFALGEMSAEEYQKARDLLRGDPPAP